MVISDEERREVAAQLASEAQAWRDTFPDSACDLGNMSSLMQGLCYFAGLSGKVLCGSIFQRFADLIDRPAVPAWVTNDGYQVCGGCHREFYVEAPAAFRCGESVHADYCPRCGAPLEWIVE